jgi:nitrite reductase/ring-hydroxylating ferredoxin subunit
MERRVFLATAVGLATCGAACSSSTSAGKPATGPVDGGNLKDVPIGTLKAVPNEPVILGRDAGGLYAMSAICTHQQCDITESGSILATSIVCSCHGSRFDVNGAVKVGPASSPLDHYSVTLAADGAITIHADKLVSLSARTPTPTT